MQFFSILQLTYRISATRQYTCATSSKIVIGRFSRNKSFFFVIKINIFIALILSGIFLEPVFVELFTGSCSQDRFRMYVPLVCIACFFSNSYTNQKCQQIIIEIFLTTCLFVYLANGRWKLKRIIFFTWFYPTNLVFVLCKTIKLEFLTWLTVVFNQA